MPSSHRQLTALRNCFDPLINYNDETTSFYGSCYRFQSKLGEPVPEEINNYKLIVSYIFRLLMVTNFTDNLTKN